MTADRPPQDPLADPWTKYRALTAARIGLERAGVSVATTPLLDFRLAHARARDAVHATLDAALLEQELRTLGLRAYVVRSAADSRATYLMQPGLGRRLADCEAPALEAEAGDHDLAFVVADGLSARAVQSHAVPVLRLVLPALHADRWRVAPLVVALGGRVALGDAVAGALKAGAVVVLIGERPGLSSPDSMGAYLTWSPSPATTDADRNCISNIRPAGVCYAEAAHKMLFLLRSMRALGYSGTKLKDESDRPPAIRAPV
jgi:ethanolamine ammonia-lyase small subunit